MQQLTNEQFMYIEQNWTKIPLTTLATKLNLTTLELCKIMRIKGISKEVKDIELQYILDSSNQGIPTTRIRDTLGLTSTQISQIYTRLGLKQKRGLRDITVDDAIKSSKWLIEELDWELDDFLPREIRQKHFSNNGLYDLIRYANYQKSKHSYYKNFSAVAYLVCSAYPNLFRPFQFGHSKNNQYFKGKDGKKNYMTSLIWVLENKMGQNLDYISTLVKSNYFLRSRDLAFYGLGYHTYKHVFRSTDDIKRQLLNWFVPEGLPFEKSKRLRNKLKDYQIPEVCAVEDCNFTNNNLLHIHHIIPKEHRSILNKLKLNIDAIENLIPLCPNHHAKAQHLIEWQQFLEINPSLWRRHLANQLKNI